MLISKKKNCWLNVFILNKKTKTFEKIDVHKFVLMTQILFEKELTAKTMNINIFTILL